MLFLSASLNGKLINSCFLFFFFFCFQHNLTHINVYNKNSFESRRYIYPHTFTRARHGWWFSLQKPNKKQQQTWWYWIANWIFNWMLIIDAHLLWHQSKIACQHYLFILVRMVDGIYGGASISTVFSGCCCCYGWTHTLKSGTINGLWQTFARTLLLRCVCTLLFVWSPFFPISIQ